MSRQRRDQLGMGCQRLKEARKVVLFRGTATLDNGIHTTMLPRSLTATEARSPAVPDA